MSTVSPHMPHPTRRAVLALVCGGLASQPARSEPMRVTEQVAIAAYLNSLLDEKPIVKTLAIASNTATADEVFIGTKPTVSKFKAEMPEASDAVIEDFLRVIAAPTVLQIPRHLVRKELRWVIADEASLARIFDRQSLGAAWKQFYKEYPNTTGLTRISRVGLDDSSAQALLYLSVTPAGLGGAGFFILLRRHFGVWRVLASKMAWVS